MEVHTEDEDLALKTREEKGEGTFQHFLRIQLSTKFTCFVPVSLLISALSYRSLGRAQSNRTVINNQGRRRPGGRAST